MTQSVRHPTRRNRPIPGMVLLLTVVALVAVCSVACLTVGPTPVTLSQVLSVLAGTDAMPDGVLVVRDLRLPRVLLALLVGSSLAVAGAVMQGITRNPLASPSVAGLSAGGTLAVFLTMLWFPSGGQLALIVAGFVGSLLAVMAVFSIATGSKSGFSGERLALAGIMVAALLGSITSLLVLKHNMHTVMLSWTLGGLSNLAWSEFLTVLPVYALGMVLALALAPQITVLNLGREMAHGLGQRTSRVVIAAMVCVLLLAGGATSVAGPVAFVGLFVPHIVRLMVGYDYRAVIPLSAAVGALFVLLADTTCRSLMQGFFEIPVGLVTTFVGLPVFLVLARTSIRRKGML